MAIALSLAIAGGSLPPLAVEGLLLAMLVGKVSLDIFRTRSTLETDEEKTIEETRFL